MVKLGLQDRHNRLLNPVAARLFLLAITSMVAIAILVLPISMRPTAYPLKVGDVATQDIQAPRDLTYTSNVLTERQRTAAEKMVSPIYLPADPSIARQQIERLNLALSFITTVRNDPFATTEQKLSDLASITDLNLSDELAGQILAISNPRWDAIQQESVSVLGQVMRNSIREPQLQDVKRSIPTLISFSLNEEQANIVTELVNAFVVPNSLYSEEQTQAAQQEMRGSVEAVQKTYLAGETIIRRGQVVDETALEALAAFGLINSNRYHQDVIAAIVLVVLLAAFLVVYFKRRRTPPLNDFRSLALIAVVFLVFLFTARYLTPNRTVIPYIFPIAAFGLTISALFNFESAIIFSLALSILAAYGLNNPSDLVLVYILGSLSGILALGRARRVSAFFWAGGAIGLAGSMVILAYRLPDSYTDWLGIATLIGASFLNGLASASLTLLFQYIFAQLLGITTTLQLLEISRPDHPLLQFMLRNAPGTYQHTLQVANLAEQAAERIGADALLTRVGAIYHDAGKSMNPTFFIENQIPGKLNPHDDLDPSLSAATIIQHVTDGVQLAKKYHLPPRIQDFIREHHGTLITRYQYTRAVEAADHNPDRVDIESFRYPGPAPRSRETALLMLADGCEARARSELPQNEQELRALIRNVVDYCQREGQLDHTPLTLKDLNAVVDSFTTTLRGLYHPRIPYPELKTKIENPSLLGSPSPSQDTVPIKNGTAIVNRK
jgi:putative nucleotidyltransferase with HDIG domain